MANNMKLTQLPADQQSLVGRWRLIDRKSVV